MILELIITGITAVLKIVLGILPNIPQLPDNITGSINRVMNVIFENVGLLGIFVRISTIKLLVPLVIIVVNFEHIYHFVMWIIKKLPLSIN